MIRFALDASFAYHRSEDTDPDLNDWLDGVADHLLDLDARGVTVVSEQLSGTFTVSLLVQALPGDSLEGVVAQGMGTIRTAFHACGGATPEWPSPMEALPAVRLDFLESSQRRLAGV